MQKIADWLEKFNLGEYAQRFAENDIDVSVLPHLTDADLEKIGVSLGHRRKMLAVSPSFPVRLRQNMKPFLDASRKSKTPPSAVKSR